MGLKVIFGLFELKFGETDFLESKIVKELLLNKRIPEPLVFRGERKVLDLDLKTTVLASEKVVLLLPTENASFEVLLRDKRGGTAGPVGALVDTVREVVEAPRSSG